MVCPAVVSGLSLIGAAYLGNPVLAAVALTICAMGIYAAVPTFWSLPTGFLTGSAAAGGIALTNSIGNLGGFVGPYAFGWIKDATGANRPEDNDAVHIPHLYIAVYIREAGQTARAALASVRCAKAEAYFERALAREEQTGPWELRAAMSMARPGAIIAAPTSIGQRKVVEQQEAVSAPLRLIHGS